MVHEMIDGIVEVVMQFGLFSALSPCALRLGGNGLKNQHRRDAESAELRRGSKLHHYRIVEVSFPPKSLTANYCSLA
jgi:hypothetical protein